MGVTFDSDALSREATALGVPLDPAALAAFTRYYDMLAAHNEAAGLTTVVEPADVRRRHFVESLALIPALAARGIGLDGASLVDVGSGAGFPGMPLALATPGLSATLMESHGRRAAFLMRLVEALGLGTRVRVVQARAEDAARDAEHRERYDIAVARALAPLATLVELTLPFVRTGGVLAAMKGSRAAEELAGAGEAIAAVGGGDAALVTLEMPGGARAHPPMLVIVHKLAPAPQRYPRRAGTPSRRPIGGSGGRGVVS